jgi:low affinity Fe/Cu permease
VINPQIIALSITVLAILGATLVNNARIGDVKDVIRAEVDARFAKLDLSLEIRFSSIDRKLDELLRVVADHDHHIRSVEGHTC